MYWDADKIFLTNHCENRSIKSLRLDYPMYNWVNPKKTLTSYEPWEDPPPWIHHHQMRSPIWSHIEVHSIDFKTHLRHRQRHQWIVIHQFRIPKPKKWCGQSTSPLCSPHLRCPPCKAAHGLETSALLRCRMPPGNQICLGSPHRKWRVVRKSPKYKYIYIYII